MLYVTKRGLLRSFRLVDGERVFFPDQWSTAHQRLASGDRWPKAALLEGGEVMANLQVAGQTLGVRLWRGGEIHRHLPTFRALHSRPPRLIAARDESLLFAAAHDTERETCVFCYRLRGNRRVDYSIMLDKELRHADRVNEDRIFLATAKKITLHDLDTGAILSTLPANAHWAGATQHEIVIVERNELRRARWRADALTLDERWQMSLPEPTMAAAPGDASLSLDGALLAVLAKTRRRLILVEMGPPRLAGVLQFEADIDLLRFVEGDRLLVALANGQLVEHWQRSLLAV